MESEFYRQLAKTIQAWLGIESEMFRLYSLILTGAHSQLVSVTFHSIESFESKISLIDMCLKLFFAQDSDEWKTWRKLRNQSGKLNAKRNIIVHQPVKLAVSDGVESFELSPSFSNAITLAKGQTSYIGSTIKADYNPSQAKLKEEHIISLYDLRKIAKDFGSLSREIQSYRENVTNTIKHALEDAKRKAQ